MIYGPGGRGLVSFREKKWFDFCLNLVAGLLKF